jgi:hypothetical protein
VRCASRAPAREKTLVTRVARRIGAPCEGWQVGLLRCEMTPHRRS